MTINGWWHTSFLDFVLNIAEGYKIEINYALTSTLTNLCPLRWMELKVLV